MFGPVLQSMRPHQWVKNSFVLAPLVFSQRLSLTSKLGQALAATAVFCAVSGAVYLINDIADRDRDRQHPVKRNRPIAAGRLPVGQARVWAIGLLSVSAGAALMLSPWFLLTLAAYFTINVAYSFSLKHVAFVDVTVIAIGFLLRVLSGALAIDVPISVWLVVCTFLLSLYLALGKRKHELVAIGVNGGNTRKVLDRYRLGHVKMAMLLAALATAAAYTAYTLDPATRAQFGTRWLPVTIPFIAFGLFRFQILTERTGHPESPTEQMVRDWPFISNVLAWGVTILVVIYV